MADDVGLDTSIPRTDWQEPHERDSDQPASKQRRRKAKEPPDKPGQPSTPPPADGVGTKIDVVG